MIWSAGFEELELVLNDFSQGFIVLRDAQIQRPTGRFDCFRKSSGFGVRRGECVQDLWRQASGKLHRLLGQFHCLPAIAQRRLGRGRQQPGQVVFCRYVKGIQFDHFLELGNGGSYLTAAFQCQTQLIVGMNGVRHLFKRLLVMFDGFVPSSPGKVNVGQIVVDLGIVRLNLKRLLELLNGLRGPPLGGQQVAQIIVRSCMIGIEFNGFLVMLDGFSGFALFGQQNSQVVLCFGKVRDQSPEPGDNTQALPQTGP